MRFELHPIGNKTYFYFQFFLLSVLMAFVYRSGFASFYQNEDFNWLNLYLDTGNIFKLWLVNCYGVFYRPLAWAMISFSQSILPFDPLYQHIRNYLACTLNLFLVLKIVALLSRDNRRALLISGLIYSFNCLHLMEIGWNNIFESTITVSTLLLTTYYCIIYLRDLKIPALIAAIFFYLCLCFCRDYPFIAILPLTYLIVNIDRLPIEIDRNKKSGLYLIFGLFFALVVYLLLRSIAMGGAPFNLSQSSFYTPSMENINLLRKGGFYLASIFNGSIPGVTELQGTLFESFTLNLIYISTWVILILTLIFFYYSKKTKGIIVFCILTIGVFIGPPLLVNNIQQYYSNEAMTILAILIGLMFAGLDRSKILFKIIFLVLVGLYLINGNQLGRSIDNTGFRFTSKMLENAYEQVFQKFPVKNNISNVEILGVGQRDLAQYIYLSNENYILRRFLNRNKSELNAAYIEFDRNAYISDCRSSAETLKIFFYSNGKSQIIPSCFDAIKIPFPSIEKTSLLVNKSIGLLSHAKYSEVAPGFLAVSSKSCLTFTVPVLSSGISFDYKITPKPNPGVIEVELLDSNFAVISKSTIPAFTGDGSKSNNFLFLKDVNFSPNTIFPAKNLADTKSMRFAYCGDGLLGDNERWSIYINSLLEITIKNTYR